MANPVLRGFQSLTRFAGRDTRGQFWPYAGVVFALMFVLGGAVMAWSMNGFIADMQQFAVEHPETAKVQSSPGYYSIQVDGNHPEAPVPDLRLFCAALGGMVVSIMALLAAAVSRRLHDSGRSAMWGLMPVPFLLFAVTGFPIIMTRLMAAEEPDLSLFFLLFFNNMLYMIALVSLIVLLALSGTRGPNRFGAGATD